VWENDQMSVFEAADLAHRIHTEVYAIGKHSMERLDPFLLSSLLCYDNGVPLDLEEKLKLLSQSSGPYYHNYNIFVENYKRKKLDYSR
jgi:hypothetical protein